MHISGTELLYLLRFSGVIYVCINQLYCSSFRCALLVCYLFMEDSIKIPVPKQSITIIFSITDMGGTDNAWFCCVLIKCLNCRYLKKWLQGMLCSSTISSNVTQHIWTILKFGYWLITRCIKLTKRSYSLVLQNITTDSENIIHYCLPSLSSNLWLLDYRPMGRIRPARQFNKDLHRLARLQNQGIKSGCLFHIGKEILVFSKLGFYSHTCDRFEFGS